MTCRLFKKRRPSPKPGKPRPFDFDLVAAEAALPAFLPADGAMKRLATGFDVTPLFEGVAWRPEAGKPTGRFEITTCCDCLLLRAGNHLYLIPDMTRRDGDSPMSLLNLRSEDGTARNISIFPIAGLKICLARVTSILAENCHD